MDKHNCPIPGCKQKLPERLSLCKLHWRQVPREIKNTVLDTREVGGEAHQIALQAAVDSVRMPDTPAVICDYCGNLVPVCGGSEVYPHRPDLWGKKFYKCPHCPDTYVGCHPSTNVPLGRMANKELRDAKMAAHEVFDALWRRKMNRDNCTRSKARTAAYKWLSAEMGIHIKKTHIGLMTVDQCAQVVRICQSVGVRS